MGRMTRNLLSGHPLAVDVLFRGEGAGHFGGGRFEGEAVAAGDFVSLRMPGNSGRAVHRGSRSRLRGVFVSAPLRPAFSFNEVLPSWNIRLDERRQSYRIELRVESSDESWSPWFYLGSGGPAAHRPPRDRVLRCPGWGRVRTDYLVLDRPAVRMQYRVTLESSARAVCHPRIGPPLLQRFFASFSNSTGDRELFDRYTGPPPARGAETEGWARVLPVPYRAQLDVPRDKIGHIICCPTCVAMILESHGIRRSTLAVAAHAYDPERRTYGIWPRAVQTAVQHGLEAWVQRFRSHADVKRLIAAGVPVMASIRVQPGELQNARYPGTSGHLILIRGFTPEGDYVVNDPYSPGPGGEEIVYSEEDMAKVWFEKGGVGIVIRPASGTETLA